MKTIFIIGLCLFVHCANGQAGEESIATGIGLVTLGGLIHSSSLYRWDFNTPYLVKTTTTLGMIYGFVGVCFFVRGIILSSKSLDLQDNSRVQFTGTGIRLWL